jgi:hypothetical protein
VKVGIMQPYFFPYIGYFQLISVVDKFIAYDDVTFIKQGWINRNRMLANGSPLLFSVPLSGAGSHTLIRDVSINKALYAGWRKKFYKTLEQYYRKAPQYETVLPLIRDVLDSEPQLISIFALYSIKAVCAYLAIKTEIVETAINYNNSNLKAEDRVIDICRQEGAQSYVNAAGGRELYSHYNFERNGIDLKFLRSRDISYKQLGYPFVAWLSIIDVLMFNTPESVYQFVNQYDLV